MSTAPAASAILASHVARFRRRAAAVMFVRWLSIASSVTLATAAVAVLLHLAAWMPATSTALAAAVVIAAFLTAVLLPSTRATAAAIDRHLQLHDAVATAVHYAAAEDAFSQLVVRDAVRRLAQVNPSQAFPLTLPRTAVVMPLAACLIVGWALGWPTLSAGLSGTGFEFSTSGARAVTKPGQAALAANPEGASTQAASTSVEQARTSPAPAAQQPEGSTAPREGARGESPPASAGGSARPQKAPEAPAAAASPVEPRSSDGGAAAPGSAASHNASRAGGVSGGDASSARDASSLRDASSPAGPPEGPSYSAAYRSGRADAETAIAQDRIPRERRAYVRDYFNAIRPPDRQ